MWFYSYFIRIFNANKNGRFLKKTFGNKNFFKRKYRLTLAFSCFFYSPRSLFVSNNVFLLPFYKFFFFSFYMFSFTFLQVFLLPFYKFWPSLLMIFRSLSHFRGFEKTVTFRKSLLITFHSYNHDVFNHFLITVLAAKVSLYLLLRSFLSSFCKFR